MRPLLQRAILETKSLRGRENPMFPRQLRFSPEKATESANGHCARSAIVRIDPLSW